MAFGLSFPAAGVLKTVDGLGMSLGIAGLGAVFFSIVGGGAGRAFVTAGEWTALASVGLLVIAFVVAFGLPRWAREVGAPAKFGVSGSVGEPGAPNFGQASAVRGA